MTIFTQELTIDLKNDPQFMPFFGIEQDVQNTENQQLELEKSKPISNVKNNWLSADGNFGFYQVEFGIAISIRYERMLYPKFSLGVNGYWLIYETNLVAGWNVKKETNFNYGNYFGIEACFRFYPWGKKLFLGLGLGYFNGGNEWFSASAHEVLHWIQQKGVGVSGEIGFKIDVGKEGGFFIQTGLLGRLLIGPRNNHYISEYPYNDKRNDANGYLSFNASLNFGFGWEF